MSTAAAAATTTTESDSDSSPSSSYDMLSNCISFVVNTTSAVPAVHPSASSVLSSLLLSDTEFASLTLRGQFLQEHSSDFSHLCDLIQRNRNIASFGFFPDQSEVQAAIPAICIVMNNTCSLRSLTIHNVHICKREAISLSRALAVSSLERVEISHCQFSGLFRSEAHVCAVEELSLESNLMGDARVAEMIKGFMRGRMRKLKIVHEGVTKSGGRLIASELRRTRAGRELTALDLSENSLGDEGVADISDGLRGCLAHKAAGSLRSLNLSRNQIEEPGGVEIARLVSSNRSLSYVNLSANSLGEQAGLSLAAAFTTSSTLTDLDLCGCCLGGRAAAAICRTVRRSILTLNLRRNAIGSRGSALVSDSLFAPGEGSILRLDLGENSIAEAGELARGLNMNHSLMALRLGKNPLGPNGVSSVVSSLPQTLEELCICECGIRDAGAKAVATAILRRENKIRQLCVRDNAIQQEGVAAIAAAAGFSGLRRLKISENAAGGAATLALMRLLDSDTLRELDMSGMSKGRRWELEELKIADPIRARGEQGALRKVRVGARRGCGAAGLRALVAARDQVAQRLCVQIVLEG